ncbi:MAG TPA: hypothetical protein VFU86_11035 [Terriglobales bacterium]|nr:hypothetical protein [Terriglobales bacterium]
MRIRITITESKGGGTTPETLISERIIETESQKQLTGKRAAQILAREHPELGLLARTAVKTSRGWMTSKSTEPLRKCGYHYVWRHYYIAEAPDEPHDS